MVKKKKNGGIRKMDRSSTIALKEGGLSMIQQQPMSWGLKPIVWRTLNIFWRKSIETLYCKSVAKSTLLKDQQLYSASIISCSSTIGLTHGNNKIWRSYRVHWRTRTTNSKGRPWHHKYCLIISMYHWYVKEGPNGKPTKIVMNPSPFI